MDKETLLKLIDFIDELAKMQGNEWFYKNLKSRFTNKPVSDFSPTQVEEIYEYCLQKIIKDHAEKFYHDFKLDDIKPKLIEDFIRMESFRRDNNFEDFCLAAYQQLELIINTLIAFPKFSNYFKENKDLSAVLRYDKATEKWIRSGNQTIGKLIFQTGDQLKITTQISTPIQTWFFNQQYRAILYFFYFSKELKYNSDQFERVFNTGNFMYQGRNLNHRGGTKSHYQQNIIDDLIPNQHKYYFKFMGFLEDFITNVNANLNEA